MHPGIARVIPIMAATAIAACAVKEAPNGAATDSNAAAKTTTAAPAAANVVHVTAKDYSFSAPDTIPAGVTTLHLMNEGKEAHEAQLVKLTDGKTYADMTAALKAMKPSAPPPSWIVPMGGPNAAPPGGTSPATQTIEPGNYAFVCNIPSSDGAPHIMKGMHRGLVVVPSTTASVPEPTPTTTLTLSDYKFDFSSPLKSGENVVRVENAADQQHEVTLFKLAAGKTYKDLEAWLPKSQTTMPPAVPHGGVAGQAKGNHAFFTVNLDAGDYALVCFFRDAKDGKPHFVHGMVQEVKIP